MTWHDHTEGSIVWPAGQERDVRKLPVAHVERWQTEEFLIVVSFDEADRVKLAYGAFPVRKPWYHDFDHWFVWGR